MTAPDESATRARTLTLVWLATLSFCVTFAIELQLFDLRVFHRWDVWFQADPNLFLAGFITGEVQPWSSLRHPLLAPVSHGFASLMASLIAPFCPESVTVAELRTWGALLVVPTAAAVRTLFLGSALHRLTLGTVESALICGIDIAAFASISVGSIPESYPLSSACLAAMGWLFADRAPARTQRHTLAWIVAATCAIGATVSNGMAVALLCAGAQWRRSRNAWQVARSCALIGVSAVALNAAVLAATLRTDAQVDHAFSQTGATISPSPDWEALPEILWTFGHTIVAPLPEHEPYYNVPPRAPREDYMFSFAPPYRHDAGSWWRALLTLAALLAGAIAWSRTADGRIIVGVCVGIMCANATLHLFFGDHYVLYMLHWAIAMMLLLAGIGLAAPRFRWAGRTALMLLLLVTSANSIWLLRQLLTELAQS